MLNLASSACAKMYYAKLGNANCVNRVETVRPTIYLVYYWFGLVHVHSALHSFVQLRPLCTRDKYS